MHKNEQITFPNGEVIARVIITRPEYGWWVRNLVNDWHLNDAYYIKELESENERLEEQVRELELELEDENSDAEDDAERLAAFVREVSQEDSYQDRSQWGPRGKALVKAHEERKK